MDDGAQRASRDLTVTTYHVPDPQPAGWRGAIDAALRSTRAPRAPRAARARTSRETPRRAWDSRAALIPAVAMLMAIAGAAGAPTVVASATARPKAVFVVGPVASETSRYISMANGLADTAASAGMDVRRIYSPYATWGAVLGAIQGAKLVVYLGHGNGWPR